MIKETLYDRLDLPRDATPEEIRRAYRELALRLHPDRNIKPGETELFMGIQEAFEVLIDPQRKATYDNLLPQDAQLPSPVIISTQYSRNNLMRISEPQLLYVLLDINIHQDIVSNSRSPLNICLVLDCSTSMQGARLDTVKTSAVELIRQLQPNDILSIIKFNDRADVILPASNCANKPKAELSVQLLQAGGGTEIFRGLQLAMQEVRQYHSPNRINHIILITDGRTYGDEVNCMHLAEQATSIGIGISTLGIGSQWNDTFLDQLTAKTGGSSKFISKPEDIRRFLMEKVFGLGQIFAEQVTFSFETHPEVELTYAFRLKPDSTPLETNSPIVMGAVPNETSQTILLEFRITSISQDAILVTLAHGRLSYKIPGYVEAAPYVQRLEFKRPVSQELDISPPPPAIVQAMYHLTLYRMQEHARADLTHGKIHDASRRLQNLATHLLAQGQRDLARSILREIAHIQKTQTFSEEGEKQIKYGTRSLLLPCGTEKKI
jgi:Ca-activated chloride channel family protein